MYKENLSTAQVAKHQREQLAHYLSWVRDEGGIEGPTHLSTWFKPNQQHRLLWLRHNVVGRVVECGCCYGYVLAFMGGQLGIDWNERSIALAQILNPEAKFLVCDIRRLSLGDDEYDTVVLPDVLEHLAWETVPRAIAEAKRVARCRVLITVPNGELDTAESTSMKHQWLATKDRIAELKKMLGPWKVSSKTKWDFVLIKADKR